MNVHADVKDFDTIIETNAAALLVDDDLYAQFYERMKAEIAAFEPDLSTATSRKEIGSLAYKMTRRKTAIDAAGKQLNEEARAKINAVDARRRRVRDDLDELAEEARRPLTAWEKQEEARIEYCKSILKAIEDCGSGFIGGEPQPFGVLLRELEEKIVITSELGEFEDQARVAHKIALDKVRTAFEAHQKAEADKRELEELRAEKERRDREEIERREAEQKAAEAAERERVEKERREQEAAEAKRREEETAQRIREEEERKASEALAKAEREKQAAIDEANRRDRERQEAEERTRREEEARAADREHRGRIMAEAKEALMAQGAGEATAKKIVLAIVAGEIPNVSMRF